MSDPHVHGSGVIRRRAYIQGLRAIAVALVMLVHADLPVPGGFVGVDVFFVISGFVITLGLLGQVDRTGTVALKLFYTKRLRRLLPALATVVVFTMVLGTVLLSPLETQSVTAKTAIGAATLSSNLVIELVSKGYFGATAQFNPLLHVWSLSLEEQFYLVLPALVVAVCALGARRRQLWVLGALSAVGLASLAMCLYIADGNSLRFAGVEFGGYYGPAGRFWEFIVGCLIAWWVHHRAAARATGIRATAGAPNLARRVASTTLAALGLLGILVASVWITPADPFPGPITLLPVLATAAVIVGCELGTQPVDWLLSRKAFTATGDYSYSLYLWHWPIIVFAKNVWLTPWAGLLGAVLSIPFAIAAYRLVEKRFRRPADDTSWRPVRVGMVTTATMICAALLLGLGAKLYWGSDRIRDDRALYDAKHAIMKAKCQDMPTHEQLSSQRCVLREGSSPESPLYLVGDSHADHMAEAILAAPSHRNRRVIGASGPACPITHPRQYNSADSPARQRQACFAFTQSLRAWLTAQRPGTVVISSADMYWSLNERHMDARLPFEPPPGGQSTGLYREGLTSLVSTLQQAGHKVVLVHTIPTYWYLPNYFHPAACPMYRVINDACTVTTSTGQRNLVQGPAREVLSTVAAERKARVVDPSDALCPAGMCSTTLNGRLAYRDTHHLTVRAAQDLADLFDPEL